MASYTYSPFSFMTQKAKLRFGRGRGPRHMPSRRGRHAGAPWCGRSVGLQLALGKLNFGSSTLVVKVIWLINPWGGSFGGGTLRFP